MVKRAAQFIVANGPVTGQDRWEEDSGYSPFTLAVEIAALLAAADLADRFAAPGQAAYLRETADIWKSRIEHWIYAASTPLAKGLGVDGYYVRIASPDTADAASPVNGFVPIKNRPPGSGDTRASLMVITRAETVCMARSILHRPREPEASMSSLCFQSALHIAAQLRSRELSAVECLEYFRARVERLNPALNAIVVFDWERAYASARRADDALARGLPCGALHGVPMTIKESFDVIGLPTTWGDRTLTYVARHDDQVVALAMTDPDRQQVLAVCERGYGKRTELEEFRQQKRGGKGIILIDTSERNGPVVGISLVNDQDEVMLVTDRGQTIRTSVAEIRLTGRNAQGVRVMNVDADERVVAIERLSERDDEDEGTKGEVASSQGDDASSEDVTNGLASDASDDSELQAAADDQGDAGDETTGDESSSDEAAGAEGGDDES